MKTTLMVSCSGGQACASPCAIGTKASDSTRVTTQCTMNQTRYDTAATRRPKQRMPAETFRLLKSQSSTLSSSPFPSLSYCLISVSAFQRLNPMSIRSSNVAVSLSPSTSSLSPKSSFLASHCNVLFTSSPFAPIRLHRNSSPNPMAHETHASPSPDQSNTIGSHPFSSPANGSESTCMSSGLPKSAVAAARGQNAPSLHSVQYTAAWPAKVPGGHGRHLAASAALASGWCVPSGHGRQSSTRIALPVGWNVPAGHATHPSSSR
mmetsp:Transcript_55578/g.130934  ORF Transcript_55578/g.130934 Transcript_55578/m.130934 type:complete len:264 (+) Transcript_55578:814-1605(+)